jgi:uncharacterized protein
MANDETKDESMTTAEAGQMGGKETAKRHGKEFYAKIGHDGGTNQGKENNPANFANDREKASEAGKEGGRNSHRGDSSRDDSLDEAA